METLRHEALNLIQVLKETLSEEEPLFASPDDCDYFRSLYRALKPALPESPKEEPKPVPPKKPLKDDVADSPREHEKYGLKNPRPMLANDPKPVSKPSVLLPQPSVLPPPKEAFDSFNDLRKLMAKIAPKIRIINEIPDDAAAKQVSQRYKTRNQAAPISLLSNLEPPQHRKLLSNLTQAIDVAFGSARLIQCGPIEKEKQWEAFLSVNDLKHVIICDSTLWQLPHLLQFYREVPSHSERFLRNVPLFLLPDLSLYLKDPLLKRSLWKALCQKIA